MRRKKQKKENNLKYRAIAIAAFILIFGLSLSAKAGYSLFDKVAEIAGSILGNRLAEKVENTDIAQFGALSGPDVYFHMFLHDGATLGGGVTATSTDDTTATFLSTDIDEEALIEFTPNVTGITATLPATSTLRSFIPNAGDTRTLLICNATTTSGVSFTLAVGTGMNLHQATSTMAIKDGDCAKLEFVRASDTDIEVYYDLGY